jgi:hypothetical protein
LKKVDEVAWRLLREVGPSVEIHQQNCWKMTIRDEEVGGYEVLEQVVGRERGVEPRPEVEPGKQV